MEPGDIFVMRNIANIVPPFELSGQYHGTSAALDFAVRQLEVNAVIVLGHWEMQHPHDGTACAADLRAMEYQCVRNSLANLMTFPWIASRSRAGALNIVGAHFDVGQGELRVFDARSDEWMLSGRGDI